MPYKTILVYFRNEQQAGSLSAAAAVLAERHSAHIIGAHVALQPESLPVMGFPMPSSILETQRKLHANEADAIKKIFDKYAANGTTSWEWRYEESKGGTVAKTAANHAHCADLIVMAQPRKNTSYIEPDMTFETLLVASGRPLLLVPEGLKPASIGEQVAIAWNGTRESARAVFDALPMLQVSEAKNATLIWLGAPTDGDTKSVPGSELAATLARHDIKVEAYSGPKPSDAGTDLLKRAGELGADLLVMGGYGHSRMREFVFGGATDHVLRHMQIPVLMSH